ncbi:hypothetical protein [Deinococcus sp.]|uniref:hypothetical protein n=1 Tax=Deinococcus sp. TaxID=47478 RepID=UPI003CC5528C
MKRTFLLYGLMIGGAGLLWLARPARRLPPDTLTTETDGLGPVTERKYWLDVEDAVLTPEQIVQRVINTFPGIMPPVVSWTCKVRGQAGQGSVGDRYFLVLLMRRAWVETESLAPDMFRNRTLRHHPDAGWVAFHVEPQGHRIQRILVHTRVRSSTRLDRLAYLLGMHAVQRFTWETVLRRALVISGGRQVSHGHHTTEFPYVPLTAS